MHYENLLYIYRKLETELLFLKKVNIRDWNVLSVEGMIFRIVTAKILNAKQKKLISLRPGTKGLFSPEENELLAITLA